MGSSAKRSVGPQARAMAIMMRWRMPPDSSCGYWPSRFSGSGMPTSSSRRSEVAVASERLMSRWMRSGSAICLPTFMTGLSEVMGSWKIIAISAPQMFRRCRRLMVVSSIPSKRTEPSRITLRRGSSPMIERERMVLPEPDSPTMPSERPRANVKLTPSTARTTPSAVSNDVRRFSTSSRGPALSRRDAWRLLRTRVLIDSALGRSGHSLAPLAHRPLIRWPRGC